MARLLLILALLLGACSHPPGGLELENVETYGTTLHGVPITYYYGDVVQRHPAAAHAHMSLGHCYVHVARTTNETSLFLTVAHEVGHCMDFGVLGASHNGFTDEGAEYAPYFATPVEGYAQAYAYHFYDSYGVDWARLGWFTPQQGEVFHPSEVRP